MWRGGIVLATLAAVCVTPLRSHDPITTKLTWTQEISRVVYKRCAGCHRPDGAAFSLLTYDDVRPWAKAIRDQVRNRTMPPWGAVKGIGEFRNDPSLSEPEIDMLIAWVEGGAPEGDAAYLMRPPAPAPAPAAIRYGRAIPVIKTWKAVAPATLSAIETLHPVEAWISRTDGSIERLLWTKSERKRQYVFREPVPLRAGDVVHLTGPATLCFTGRAA